MVTMDGDTIIPFVVEMEDRLMFEQFQTEYSRLKEMMAQNMEMFTSGRRSVSDHEHYFRHTWVPSALAFVATWGKEKVPPDLRRGINSAESGVDLARTQWPPIPDIRGGTT
jgi:hypothetical protein